MEKVSLEQFKAEEVTASLTEELDPFIEYFCIQEKIPFQELMNTLERSIIIRALEEFNGNQKAAAQYLGIKHTTLNQKVKKHNILFQKKAF